MEILDFWAGFGEDLMVRFVVGSCVCLKSCGACSQCCTSFLSATANYFFYVTNCICLYRIYPRHQTETSLADFMSARGGTDDIKAGSETPPNASELYKPCFDSNQYYACHLDPVLVYVSHRRSILTSVLFLSPSSSHHSPSLTIVPFLPASYILYSQTFFTLSSLMVARPI